MIWLGWRQQRTETLIVLGIIAALAALLIPTGISMESAVNDQPVHAFTEHFSSLGNVMAWLTLIPGLIGVLLAAPFVLSLERGTYRLDWTQSFPRRRWIVTKLGLAVVSALVAAGVLLALLTWWHEPMAKIQGRIVPAVYDSEGTVVFAYTLFALAVVAAIGAVWRKAVPALTLGLVTFIGARVFVDTWLRQRLVPADTVVWNVKAKAPNLDKAWILEQFPARRGGEHVPFISCPVGKGGACEPPASLHHAFVHATYQPASHFWSLQLMETAIFGVIAVSLLGFAAWWTRNRVA